LRNEDRRLLSPWPFLLNILTIIFLGGMRCWVFFFRIIVILQLLNFSRTLNQPKQNLSPRRKAIAKVLPFTRPLVEGTTFTPTSFKDKKVVVLRRRVAESRAVVNRCINEIEALEKRRDALTTPLQVRAVDKRLVELRKEAGIAEGKIVLLKAKQSKMGVPRREGIYNDVVRWFETILATEEGSARVLQKQVEEAANPIELLREDTMSLFRLSTQPSLVKGYVSLEGAQRLIPHTAAIAARIAKLERYAPGILVAADGYIDLIEPHLDTILERLDEIEPHIPFVLDNLDVLAPHIGTLMPHIDSLLLFADDGGKYLPVLLPYVPRFAPLLDDLACHLVLLRPHMRHILPHFQVIAQSAHKFKKQLKVSENADILVWYFGWVLRIPWLGKSVLNLSFMPRLAAWLGCVLPRYPVRKGTTYVRCNFEGCEVYA